MTILSSATTESDVSTRITHKGNMCGPQRRHGYVKVNGTSRVFAGHTYQQ